MTELRKRMIETLQLRGYSQRTQECYLRAPCSLSWAHIKGSGSDINIPQTNFDSICSIS
jgi:hypothetical protein